MVLVIEEFSIRTGVTVIHIGEAMELDMDMDIHSMVVDSMDKILTIWANVDNIIDNHQAMLNIYLMLLRFVR